jgi:hypothetical protein
MVKVGLFTLLTVLAAVALVRMDTFSWSEAAGGLAFELPRQGIATAVAVFGITGVGATELFMYPYWCVEKGYARFVGRYSETPAWRARARGWVRVMHLDILASMAVYTVATVAFYLLGAGILHARGTVPASSDMIPVLSTIYTGTLGPWVLPLFYAGAVVVLYGTIFAATAAHSRLFADMCRVMGLYARDDYRQRVQYRRGFVILLTVLPAVLFLVFVSPVKMVVAGGIVQSVMLPVVGFGTLYLRYRRLPADLAPTAAVTAGLWVASAVMLAATAVYARSVLCPEAARPASAPSPRRRRPSRSR